MFALTVLIILIVFSIDIILSILNYVSRNRPITENVSDVYDPSSYHKWLDYVMETHRLSILSKIANTMILLLFLFLDFLPFFIQLFKSLLK